MSGINVIAHNLPAMFSNRELGIVNNRKAKSAEKLTSGYKINRAADDAAGLSISEKMRKKIRGLNQGAANMQDGISLCQVADGALAETQDILQRMNELCVKSANGTMSPSDRQDIQNEIGELKEEIDRIANTTEFNDFILPLKGGPYRTITESAAEIPFDNIKIIDFDMADVGIGQVPFGKYDGADHLVLQAVVDKPDSVVNKATFNLIYGNGSTSNSSMQIGYEGASGENLFQEVDFDDLVPNPNKYRYDESSSTYFRTFDYSKSGLSISITQSVKINNEDKSYQINHYLENTGNTKINAVMFMEHFDTAYNNDDYNEEQFVDGNKITNNCVLLGDDNHAWNMINRMFQASMGEDAIKINKYIGNNGKNISNFYTSSDMSFNDKGLSIASLSNALPFTESLEFTKESVLLSIGHYSQVDDWEYYKNLGGNLGRSTVKEDLGVSAFYFTSNIDSGDGAQIGGLKYGIKDIKTDPNITGDYKYGTITKIEDLHGIDIQCSDESRDIINIPLVDATAKGIGLEGKNGTIDASTMEGARQGIDLVSGALIKVNEYRTNFGVHQNRLEHAYNINLNSSENTQYAESRIRDTDMADEMVKFSKDGILQQAGQAMLSQANQVNQGVLSLLQ